MDHESKPPDREKPKPSALYARRELARERERKAWALRQKLLSQREIAAELGVTQGAVAKMLRRVEARYFKQQSKRVEHIKTKQSFQLEHLGSEAVAAWERSKRPGKKIRRKVGADGEVTVTEVIERDGDPRFLSIAIETLAEERKVWNIGAEAEGATGVINIEELHAALIEVSRRGEGGGGAVVGDEG
jgi:predicted transcriptional regulator